MTENSISRRLYRLLRAAEWRAAGRSPYRAAARDTADGFIHLSTAGQVEGTANRYYRGLDDVILLTLDSRRLHGEIRLQPSTCGAWYPHPYGVIPLAAVMEAQLLPLTCAGLLTVPFLRGG